MYYNGTTYTAQHYDGDTPTCDSTTAPESNTWYHVAAVFASDSSRSIYVNGILEGTSTQAQSALGASQYIHIGCLEFSTSYSQFFDGLINDVRFFNRALTSNEVARIYTDNAWQYSSGIGWLLCGDSRIVGVDTSFSAVDTNQMAGILQSPSSSANDSWKPAYEPLVHFIGGTGVGPGYQMARDLYAAYGGVGINLLPCGQGGLDCTDFATNTAQYIRMADKIAWAKQSKSAVSGVLLCLGANDVANDLDEDFLANCGTLVDNLRSEIGSDVPFCLIDVPTNWLPGDARVAAVNDAIDSIVSSKTNCYRIYTSALSHNVDNLHEDAEGARDIGSLAADIFKTFYGK